MDLKFKEKVAKQLVNKGYIKQAENEESLIPDYMVEKLDQNNNDNIIFEIFRRMKKTSESDPNFNKVLKIITESNTIYGFWFYTLLLNLKNLSSNNPYYNRLIERCINDFLINDEKGSHKDYMTKLIKKNIITKDNPKYDDILKRFNSLDKIYFDLIKTKDENFKENIEQIIEEDNITLHEVANLIKRNKIRENNPYFSKIIEIALNKIEDKHLETHINLLNILKKISNKDSLIYSKVIDKLIELFGDNNQDLGYFLYLIEDKNNPNFNKVLKLIDKDYFEKYLSNHFNITSDEFDKIKNNK